MRVREIEPRDIDRFVEMGVADSNELNPLMTPDPVLIHHYVNWSLTPGGRHFRIFVAEADGDLCGFLTAEVKPFMQFPARYAEQHLIYVTPEKRGSTAMFRMWQAFVAWAGAEGAIQIYAGISAGIDPDAAGSLFERLGMQAMGRIYRLDLPRISVIGRGPVLNDSIGGLIDAA